MESEVVVWITSPELRRQISEFLRSFGLAVVFADGRDQALDAAGQEGIGLILADASVHDGRVLAGRIAERGRRTRTLLISGNPEDVNRAAGPDPGLHFIEKPFAWRDLRSRVETLLTAA
jgi:DNA-binding response OmpR family regulator